MLSLKQSYLLSLFLFLGQFFQGWSFHWFSSILCLLIILLLIKVRICQLVSWMLTMPTIWVRYWWWWHVWWPSASFQYPPQRGRGWRGTQVLGPLWSLPLLVQPEKWMDNYYKQALPETQWTQGIEYIDSFNTLKSRRSFNEHWNLGQTLRLCFCLPKGKKCNNNNNFDQSM